MSNSAVAAERTAFTFPHLRRAATEAHNNHRRNSVVRRHEDRLLTHSLTRSLACASFHPSIRPSVRAEEHRITTSSLPRSFLESKNKTAASIARRLCHPVNPRPRYTSFPTRAETPTFQVRKLIRSNSDTASVSRSSGVARSSSGSVRRSDRSATDRATERHCVRVCVFARARVSVFEWRSSSKFTRVSRSRHF